MQPIYWLGIFVALMVIEAVTMGLTTIWFAGGSLTAFVVGMIGGPFWLQITVFLASSVGLLLVTRPLAKKHLNGKVVRTNVDRLIGQQARVIQEIDTLGALGQVEIGGQEWSAKTEDPNGVISVDTTVIVERIQGVKLVVKEKE